MSKTRSTAVLALVLTLAAGSALAGTTGTEFQTMYTTLLNWATGFLGKSIAIAAFILGAGIGIARSSPIPALVGVVFAKFIRKLFHDADLSCCKMGWVELAQGFRAIHYAVIAGDYRFKLYMLLQDGWWKLNL